jgi:hypothetical protein
VETPEVKPVKIEAGVKAEPLSSDPLSHSARLADLMRRRDIAVVEADALGVGKLNYSFTKADSMAVKKSKVQAEQERLRAELEALSDED